MHFRKLYKISLIDVILQCVSQKKDLLLTNYTYIVHTDLIVL